MSSQGASASGDSPIIVLFDTGRKYIINSNGTIEQDQSSVTGSFSLTYKPISSGLQIYPQVNNYDKAYYDALTEYAISSENFWAIDNGYIAEGTVWSSITDVINYWGYDYSSLKEYYEKECSNDFNSCADMLASNWDLGYAEYIAEHEDDNGYEEYALTIYNQVQSLLPEEYFITITCNGETQRINYAEVKYAEFEIAEKGDYPVHAVNNQNNSEADITAKIPSSFTISGQDFFFDEGMNWSSWMASSYSEDSNCSIYTYEGNDRLLSYVKGIEGIWYDGFPLMYTESGSVQSTSDHFVLPSDDIIENAEYWYALF